MKTFIFHGPSVVEEFDQWPELDDLPPGTILYTPSDAGSEWCVIVDTGRDYPVRHSWERIHDVPPEIRVAALLLS